MRQRTPSEIKAYGDGYAEAYKEFCHLLERHDKDKAIRKMKIFVDAVALTVETATDTADTPQTEPMKTADYCDICKQDMCELCIADASNPYCVPSHYEINYEPNDEPKTQMKTQNLNLTFETDTPQTDCGWK